MAHLPGFALELFLKRSWFAQLLLKMMLRRRRPRLLTTIIDSFLQSLRRGAIVALSDPCVLYDLKGTKLLLPLSHELPFIRKHHPDYSDNIGTIASVLAEKYSGLTIVDIGANVGDTAAIVRDATASPILCIDGDSRFFAFLELNTKVLTAIDRCQLLVGGSNTNFAGSIESSKGTARLVADSSSTRTIKTKTLSEILNTFPAYGSAKLIKIDTDGFDTLILKSELDLLSRLKPVLFFEYDPFFFAQNREDGFTVFSDLKKIGYSVAIFYANTGEFMLRSALAEVELLRDLHHQCRNDSVHRYFDVCVATADDMDVLDKLRSIELSRVRPTQ